MTRIAILEREEMNEAQGEVYDRAVAEGTPTGGPYYAYIRIPELMATCQDMRACLQAGPLSRREGQIINLACARHWDARYPWTAQVRASRNVGVEDDIIDAINANEDPPFTSDRDATVYKVARELLATNRLSDETYAAAEKLLGLEHLVAAVATTGQFSMTCCTANAFDVSPPADAPTPLKE